MNIQVDKQQQTEGMKVSVNGEIDAFTAPVLREKLETIEPTAGMNVELDMSEVTYMDSTGLGVIVGFFKNMKAHDAEVKLTGLSSRLKRLFDITGLGEIMNIETDNKGGKE